MRRIAAITAIIAALATTNTANAFLPCCKTDDALPAEKPRAFYRDVFKFGMMAAFLDYHDDTNRFGFEVGCVKRGGEFKYYPGDASEEVEGSVRCKWGDSAFVQVIFDRGKNAGISVAATPNARSALDSILAHPEFVKKNKRTGSRPLPPSAPRMASYDFHGSSVDILVNEICRTLWMHWKP